jgi:subtilisin family serine protease
MDLRGYDLSALDLRDSPRPWLDAELRFDSGTVWPPEDRLPPGFDPKRVLELGKNPGLGLRDLHAQGITGRGVGIGIVDYPLLTEHQEYADQLQWYEEINADAADRAHRHGSIVASIAVGRQVGVAPEASLYYIGVGNNLKEMFLKSHYEAQAVRRILEINAGLPEGRKIRVISMSFGWGPQRAGYYDMTAAVEEATAEGLLIVCATIERVHGFDFEALGRSPLADPDAFDSYEPALWWAEDFYAGYRFSDHLMVPTDSLTLASPTGADAYAFERAGGSSKAIPYIAGVYALAVQVDPAITPERFWTLAVKTGRTIELAHDSETIPLGPIVDPTALISALQSGVGWLQQYPRGE